MNRYKIEGFVFSKKELSEFGKDFGEILAKEDIGFVGKASIPEGKLRKGFFIRTLITTVFLLGGAYSMANYGKTGDVWMGYLGMSLPYFGGLVYNKLFNLD